jgi:hypothetical protein
MEPASADATAAPATPEALVCGARAVLADEDFDAAVLGRRIKANRRVKFEGGGLEVFNADYRVHDGEGTRAVLKLEITVAQEAGRSRLGLSADARGFTFEEGERERMLRRVGAAVAAAAGSPACQGRDQKITP